MSSGPARRHTYRWHTYQRERFPVVRHGLLVLLTTACVLAYSAHSHGGNLDWGAVAPAAAVNFLMFFLLRVADEFKDFEDDSRYRPERPVPRGLVKLNELRNLALVAAVVQLVLVLLLRPAALPLLLACWVFMALMTTEFFAPRFLKARPGLYLLSHQPIVPLLQLLASAWDWARTGVQPPVTALVWLVVVSFGAGLTLELGRKLKSPEQERPGVEMYTGVWGIPGAMLAWLAAVSLACGAALLATRGGGWAGLPLLGVWLWAAVSAQRFKERPTPHGAETLENLSAAVVLLVYVTLALRGSL